ncbi:MAG: universal stress protein [Halobacteriales archaeon]
MYENILIPTDGSEQATNAAKAGLALAADLGASVHVLTVLGEFESRIVPISGEQDELREEQHEHGEEIVGAVADAAEELGVDATTSVSPGIVHKEIESYVEERDIDLIVMGSRGLTNVEKALLGSTADKVVRTLDIPTMVVHQTPEAWVDMDRDIHIAGW